MSVTENTSLLGSPHNDVGEQEYGSQSSAGSISSSRRPYRRRSDESKDDDEGAEVLTIRKSVWWTLPALAVGIFLSAADQTLVVASYGKIGTEFSALNKTSWIATAYVTCATYHSTRTLETNSHIDTSLL